MIYFLRSIVFRIGAWGIFTLDAVHTPLRNARLRLDVWLFNFYLNSQKYCKHDAGEDRHGGIISCKKCSRMLGTYDYR
jgi:hypothetical protein